MIVASCMPQTRFSDDGQLQAKLQTMDAYNAISHGCAYSEMSQRDATYLLVIFSDVAHCFLQTAIILWSRRNDCPKTGEQDCYNSSVKPERCVSKVQCQNSSNTPAYLRGCHHDTTLTTKLRGSSGRTGHACRSSLPRLSSLLLTLSSVRSIACWQLVHALQLCLRVTTLAETESTTHGIAVEHSFIHSFIFRSLGQP